MRRRQAPERTMTYGPRRSRHRLLLWAVLAIVLLPSPVYAASHTLALTEVQKRLESWFVTPEGGQRTEGTSNAGIQDAFVNTESLRPFYRKRGFRPAWLGPTGPVAEARSLIETIRRADTQGLEPSDYHLPQILSRLAGDAPEPMSELDILLSDAFLRYCLDLVLGRTDPRDADPEWFLETEGIDHMAVLGRALASRTLDRLLSTLYPSDPRYSRLRQALEKYRRIAATGSWAPLPEAQTLKVDVKNPAVMALRRRLKATGDLGEGGGGDLFDPEVEEAVRRFQQRHGLDADGVVGPKTRAALDLPVEERIRQLVLNLERWRWMPKALENRYLLVNMAGFDLRAMEEGRSVMSMRVVVGRAYRRTPAFDKTMTYLVFNPYWNVPPSLAVRDILPKVRQDSDYLTRLGIRVFSDWSESARELDPHQIDWSQVSARRFPYKLRQDPGPRNALGRIKFMLPNKFNIYLHDTPHREHFPLSVRAFSSGCIRLERPEAMAVYVLRGAGGWTPERVHATVESRERRVQSLPEPVPVYLVYWTAWVEPDGTVHFRDDIYGRDGRMWEALNRRREARSPAGGPSAAAASREQTGSPARRRLFPFVPLRGNLRGGGGRHSMIPGKGVR